MNKRKGTNVQVMKYKTIRRKLKLPPPPWTKQIGGELGCQSMVNNGLTMIDMLI